MDGKKAGGPQLGKDTAGRHRGRARREGHGAAELGSRSVLTGPGSLALPVPSHLLICKIGTGTRVSS